MFYWIKNGNHECWCWIRLDNILENGYGIDFEWFWNEIGS